MLLRPSNKKLLQTHQNKIKITEKQFRAAESWHCDATLIKSVGITYKLAFYIHNVGKKIEKNECKKDQSLKIFKHLGII